MVEIAHQEGMVLAKSKLTWWYVIVDESEGEILWQGASEVAAWLRWWSLCWYAHII